MVALGDFDDTPDSAAMRFWTGRQSLDGVSVAYRDAWEAVHADLPGHTFAADNPLTCAGEMALELGRRIDLRAGALRNTRSQPRHPRLPPVIGRRCQRRVGKRPLRGAGRVGRPDSSARSLDPAWLRRRVGDSVTTPIVR